MKTGITRSTSSRPGRTVRLRPAATYGRGEPASQGRGAVSAFFSVRTAPSLQILGVRWLVGEGSRVTYGIVEEFLVVAVGYLRLTVEAIGATIVGLGAVSTAFRYALSLLALREYTNADLRLHLGRYLSLGLEFQLGADILGTAIAPTWEAVQLLAAIVVIRTVLNYFLQKELERERREAVPVPDRDASRN
jgi:uncharacterized membrane protein